MRTLERSCVEGRGEIGKRRKKKQRVGINLAEMGRNVLRPYGNKKKGRASPALTRVEVRECELIRSGRGRIRAGRFWQR